MASSSKKVKTYYFHSEWEEQYFFTEVKGKNVCLLCNTSVSVAKKGNIERHHTTVHSNFEKSFPLHSVARKEKLKQLKKQLIGQQSIFLRTVDKNKAATEASYRVSQIIAQKKKPYEDGEMIKQAFLEAADSLFANFRNKDEILSAIKSMQLSANTVMRRVEVMSNDIFLQLRTDLDNCVYFSLQLDESTDVVDTAQMAVFVRMVFSDFTIKEDLLKFIPLEGHTTGQELFSHLKNIISSEKIPISKMVGLTTDGAPAMVGCDKGLVALCRKDETFPQFLSYHCIIHQQALCGNFLKLNNVMKLVVKIVNKIRAQALQRRLFKILADEVDCQYGDLLLHSEVRWLSRGRVLKRFNDVLSGIVQFFKQRDEPIPVLENSIWLRDFGFLVDITEKLNELYLQLQGRDKELAEMISDIKAFIRKLEFWEQNLINSDAKHFPILSEKISENPLEPYDSKYHVEIVSTLKNNFKNRFKDFDEMALVAQFVVSPFMEIDIQQFATCVMQNFGEDIAATEMEVIEFQNDLALKSLVSSTKCIWPIVSKDKYSVLCRVALKVKALFSSTYLCESSFSNMKFIKNKYRNRLTDEHLDNCIRMAVSNYTANIKKIIDESECQPSH
jgi:hypothetical protein